MIRKSTPADAAQVIPLIDIVFEEMEIPTLMNMPKPRLYTIFEQAFLLPDYRYGYPQTLVAEQDGKVKGIAVGYPHSMEAHIDDAFVPFLPSLGLAADRPLFPDQETYANEWYLDTLAVAPEARGQGVGTQLLQALPEQVAQSDPQAQMLSLNVDQANPLAEKLYRRQGFHKQGELMIGQHRYNHLVKPL